MYQELYNLHNSNLEIHKDIKKTSEKMEQKYIRSQEKVARFIRASLDSLSLFIFIFFHYG